MAATSAALKNLIESNNHQGRPVKVIFAPGLGGKFHPTQAWNLLGTLGVRCDNWSVFPHEGAGGQTFCDYDKKDTFLVPGGRSVLKPLMLRWYKNQIMAAVNLNFAALS
ncbi:unnamed protein product [Polarella glacialis]|uniref:Uncharacterized protein n=1 Tax=Polarella glacialis TaxID=89957 RepID=A0A813JKJ1_POLGL|nr:unnamed protein product [Polarella glacialis]